MLAADTNLYLLKGILQVFPFFLAYVADGRLRMTSQKTVRATFYLHMLTALI